MLIWRHAIRQTRSGQRINANARNSQLQFVWCAVVSELVKSRKELQELCAIEVLQSTDALSLIKRLTHAMRRQFALIAFLQNTQVLIEFL